MDDDNDPTELGYESDLNNMDAPPSTDNSHNTKAKRQGVTAIVVNNSCLCIPEFPMTNGGPGLESLVDQQISIITNDGRNIVGVLKGFDQETNIILDESYERVYSTMKQFPLPISTPQQFNNSSGFSVFSSAIHSLLKQIGSEEVLVILPQLDLLLSRSFITSQSLLESNWTREGPDCFAPT
ncbi:hypothetical protein IFM89_005785 [Coptis chinensis]|uniref:U6 snRNA-associated Sm-like protein LSm8 n=1 Tax=Coptis chinensis TaxID=261450 RepID=A0A835IJU7_9MAGN|nr:hypothetical protein IFM89_005785 [Coptis chinensis]